MEALIHYEANIGPHGHPIDVATDEDMDGWFEVRTRKDHAQAAIEKWRADNPKPEPGTRMYVVNTLKTPNSTDD